MEMAVQASKAKWNYEEGEGRIEKYQEYDAFYHGDHPNLIPDKFKTVLADRLGIVDNFCSLVVDKGTSFLVGKPLRFEVKDQTAIEEWLKKVWKQNNMQTQMLKAQRTNGTKGDVFLKPTYNEETKKVVIRVLRPDIMFPNYSDEDYETMESCEIKFEKERDGIPYMFVQVWTLEDIKEYEASPDPAEEWKLIKTLPNKYKIMPIHVRNKILDKPFGESDLEDMIPLQKAFNKILTDIMKISEDQAFKHLWATGVRQGEEGKLEHGPGKLWSFASPDAKVGGIEPASIEQLVNFLEFLADEIAHKGRVPEFKMTTMIKDISGVALRMMYGDMIERTDERITIWTDCLRQLLIYLVRIGVAESLFTGKAKEEDLEIKIVFDTSLPVDRKEQMEWIEKQVDLQLKSKRRAMKEIGIEHPEEEEKKIKEEVEDEYATRSAEETEALGKRVAALEKGAGGGVVE